MTSLLDPDIRLLLPLKTSLLSFISPFLPFLVKKAPPAQKKRLSPATVRVTDKICVVVERERINNIPRYVPDRTAVHSTFKHKTKTQTKVFVKPSYQQYTHPQDIVPI